MNAANLLFHRMIGCISIYDNAISRLLRIKDIVSCIFLCKTFFAFAELCLAESATCSISSFNSSSDGSSIEDKRYSLMLIFIFAFIDVFVRKSKKNSYIHKAFNSFSRKCLSCNETQCLLQ